MNAYQLKISVKNSKPLRWRRCIIPAGITYSQLSLLLSSLMEQSQEKPFSFEFYHAKIRFRENDGQQPFQSNFYYSLGDAAENYINELLDSQEWFSFYWGEDLALRVNIEKRLPDFSEAYPLLLAGREGAPGKNEDPSAFRSRLEKIQADWKQKFFFRSDKVQYRKRDELLQELKNGRYGMNCCEHPVSRTENIKRSGNSYLQEFADHLRQIFPELAKGEFPHSLFEPAADSPSPQKSAESQGAKCSPGASSEGRPRTSLGVLLKSFSKRELLDEARDLRIQRTAGLNKDMLAEKIANEMLRPSVMREHFLALDDQEAAAWERAIKKPNGFTASEEEQELLMPLHNKNYLTVFLDNTVEITKDVIAGYDKINTADFQALRSRISWLLACLRIQSRLYPAAPVSVMIRMYRRRPGYSINREEWLQLFDQIPHGKNHWFIHHDRIFNRSLSPAAISACEEQFDKEEEYYIPGEDEILDYNQNGYPSRNPCFRKLETLLLTQAGISREKAENVLMHTYDMLAVSESIPALSAYLEGVFPGRMLPASLSPLLAELDLYTRKIRNKGYTDADAMEKAGLPVGRPSSHQNGRPSAQKPSASPARTMPTKIYPNDPCPCGSGKKYKKCCGKK